MTKQEYDTIYRDKNRKRIKKKQAAYYKKNKLSLSRKAKIYRIKNKEKLSLSKKRYYLKNRARLIKYVQERYDRDKKREYDKIRRQDPIVRQKRNMSMALWRIRNPEKRKAHSTISNAIRDGRFKRSQCEVCGSIKSHGHHEDYSKPLDVKWLCAIHHKQEHGRLYEFQ